MDTALIAARSVERASAQHIQARLVAPGHYRSHSRSGNGWYDIHATRVGQHIQVICSCPGGWAYKDDQGSSCCKHAASVSKRLLAHPAELAHVPSVAAPARISWEDVLNNRPPRAARREEAEW